MPDISVFLPFPRLPIEIRRLIWAHALPRGRVQLFAKSVPWENWRLHPPLIAHVCHESREVARDLAVVRGFPTARDKHNETWFIGSRDVLELASGYPYPLSNPEPFFAAAEALAINAGDFRGDIRAVVRDLIGGTRFHSVKVVYLVAEQISTAYWPRFRPDLTDKDKGKGTILDLCDSDDLQSIAAYKAWARTQEMSPVFPNREEVEMILRAALDELVVEELNAYRHYMALESRGAAVTQDVSQPHQPLYRDDPWIQQQWKRLPDFRPALLVLGWS
ncbi:hypothetical protein F5B22DRAFT_118364 [Xylaria bambusicola]|uniref:uncharacterized protein n=1 Tax=Xylaria bambusicola TaxID=326684 RepID=UPI00200803C6|nr:uncharacterized protein F5B22DRAFT_118364 [Xylaria bambusicola]KAI0517324.1 hypothetical protein F5B22DRAFT_118364 [Xylaria bambusicola]